ncbi:short-chain dehydrogenase [Paenibacillus sp. J31TS4]|uniref:SDR family NAD(P)-dependent oxidoreductase n=1 Tax=Paenibacillus sp. J31TS4 TaxID=2807195 RepID=UPI001B08F847|nr:SDR family oxidoreductase [Paenibacillus sp. J31TS4]GIP41249.1 short-chain dehydrogenase [Paenibacillus sp. J31TS4]
MGIFAPDALAGKHALVTGATGGIGRATARLLAGMGASLTVTGRNETRLGEMAEAIRKETPGARIAAVPAELTEEEDRRRLVREAEGTFGPVGLLVNNAGMYRYGTVETETDASLSEMLQVNFTATVLLTQLLYPGMRELGGGAVVNVSSLSGLRGGAGHTAYAASKFALIGFTHSFALEAIRHNIRVNAVCPGYVDTRMGYQVIGEQAAASGSTLDEQLARTHAGIPSGRITTPDEVAHTIAFLLTEAAGNMVGASVKLSGGAVL